MVTLTDGGLAAKKGDVLKMKFISDKALSGTLKIDYTNAHDYGIFDVYLNGKKIESNLDLYSPKLEKTAKSYKNTTVKKGDNIIKVVLKGKNPKSKPANMFGIDYVELQK